LLQTGAWRIQQHPVKPSHHPRKLARIVIADNDVLHLQVSQKLNRDSAGRPYPSAEAVDVANQTLGTSLAGIVGEDDTSVLHQRRHVRRLTTGSCGHLQGTTRLALWWLEQGIQELTSRQRSFSWGQSAMTGRNEDAACRM